MTIGQGDQNRRELPSGAGAPRFSIVVPVYREQGLINRCLAQVNSLQRIREAEVIVADGDGGSTVSAIEEQSFSFTLKKVLSPMGRGVQQNRGAAAAVTEMLIFLHVDTRIPHNALSLVEDALRRFAAGAFSLGIDSSRGFLKLGERLANLRSKITRIPYGDQALFMRRDAFFSLGGFQEIPLMEDVALALELRKRGIPIHILREKTCTSDRRWRDEGAVRGTVRNWMIYTLFRIGVSPDRLIGYYRPHTS